MQSVDEYISKVQVLPPVPRVVLELMKLLNEPEVDLDKVVQLISLEPALTANVLRLCNSAWLATATPTTDLQQAVTRLGFQQIYQIVTAASGSRLFRPGQKSEGFDHLDLWKHSVASAVIAQMMAKILGDDENMVFTATLLHDLGKVILAQSSEVSYAKLLQEAAGTQVPLMEAEKRILGVNHAEVGGRLLSRWNFPSMVVSAVAFHHSPKAAGGHERPAAFAYLGNMVAYFMGYGFGKVTFDLAGRADALAILGLAPETIPKFMVETQEKMHVIEAMFSLGPE